MPIEKSKMRLAEKKERPFFIAVFLGFIASLLFLFAFLLVASVAVYAVPDPAKLLLPLSYAVLILTGLLSGVASGRFSGRHGALAGFLSGILFSLFLTLCTYFGGNFDTKLLPVFILTYLAFSFIAAFGGRIGCRKKEKRRVRRRTS